jgi:manganese/zinc/iron transport system permease protein
MSLLGDAISHAVLPGLAVAFLLSGARNSLMMFAGAIAVGLLTSLLSQFLRERGRVDEGASMGVVFTSLFALGLLLIVRAADHVDLDPGCVLYGAIESIVLDQVELGGFDVPQAVLKLLVICAINFLFLALFFKELKLTTFDPALATVTGFPASLMHHSLMTFVALTTVACFECVGSILVIAMLIVPAASALLLCKRLVGVLVVSLIIGVCSAIVGHVVAVGLPRQFGFGSTSSAGSMACVLGLFFLVVCLLGPQQGVVSRWLRQWRFGWRVLSEDLIATLYRLEEQKLPASFESLRQSLLTNHWRMWWVLRAQQTRGFVNSDGGQVWLTERGREQGQAILRSHRLWERYLVDQGAVPAERVHEHAERFEHYTSDALKRRLNLEGNSPRIDPHGRQIPGEHEP